MKTRILFVVVSTLIGATLFAVGRQSNAVENASIHALNIEIAEKQAEVMALTKKQPNNPVDISSEYKIVANDPIATQGFLMVMLHSFYWNKASATTAAQITQMSSEESVRLQALQVAQNARIISALDEISKKLTK